MTHYKRIAMVALINSFLFYILVSWLLKLQKSFLNVVITLIVITLFMSILSILDKVWRQAIQDIYYNSILIIIGVISVKYLHWYAIFALFIVIMIRNVRRYDKNA